MAAGYLLRKDQALAEAGERPCPGCGHPTRRHRELQPTWELRDGEIIEMPHPDYQPFVFHCEVEGCGCALDRAAA